MNNKNGYLGTFSGLAALFALVLSACASSEHATKTSSAVRSSALSVSCFHKSYCDREMASRCPKGFDVVDTEDEILEDIARTTFYFRCTK
ncbi:MAG TPA: hypothetical protein VI895_15210 [Bdellovibrionota bacterium]|nr:hypothetical protein [Bdellovibrionota bacterium]